MVKSSSRSQLSHTHIWLWLGLFGAQHKMSNKLRDSFSLVFAFVLCYIILCKFFGFFEFSRFILFYIFFRLGSAPSSFSFASSSSRVWRKVDEEIQNRRKYKQWERRRDTSIYAMDFVFFFFSICCVVVFFLFTSSHLCISIYDAYLWYKIHW